MKISNVTLYWNTPLTTFNNTIHFDSEGERENFFNTHYKQRNFNLNMAIDRLTIRVPMTPEEAVGVNYCRVVNAMDKKKYYFFILQSTHYVNDGVVTFDLVPDALMSFTQGNVLSTLKNVRVLRQHLPNAEYNTRLMELRTNDDILKTTTKQYVHTVFYPFKDLAVIFQCSVNLELGWGEKNKPSIKLPQGIVYDNLPSPVGLYYCELSNWREFNGELLDYPWIGQNINNVILVPKTFIDTNDLLGCALNGKDTTLIKKFRNNGYSANKSLATYSEANILSWLGYNSNEKHLVRSEYCTIEMMDYSGQLVPLDPAFMPSTGIELMMYNATGYSNSVAVFPRNWANNSDSGDGQVQGGAFLNNALWFKDFANLPVLIDNYKLSLANSANQRAYAESRTLSGRVESIQKEVTKLPTGGLNNAQDLFVDAYSLLGGGIHPATIASKIVDDVEFYRQQQAQFADMALASPSLSKQSEGQAFNVANSIYGITIKFSAPTNAEKNHIRQYYNSMGFAFNEIGNVYDIHSMSIANFLQIEGQLVLPNVPSGFVQMISSLLATGVRFWHANGMDNPMTQNINQNTRRV